jgi:hypothetical protein
MLRRREAAALARVVDQIKADDGPQFHVLLKRIREVGFATPNNYLLMIGVGW